MPIRRFSYYISETFANLQTGVSQRLKPSRCLFRRTHKGFLDRYHSLCSARYGRRGKISDPRSGSQNLYYKRPAPIDLAIAKAGKAKDEMAMRPDVFIASAALASSSSSMSYRYI